MKATLSPILISILADNKAREECRRALLNTTIGEKSTLRLSTGEAYTIEKVPVKRV